MIGSEILQNLFDERDALSDMIIEIQPRSDDERKQLQTLMRHRDSITGVINQIIAKNFNEAAAGLADKASALEKLTERLNQLNKTIGNVGTAIQVADEIIKVAVSIMALAATV
jgi:uncharacterized protein YdcH (DUF465 family)